MIFFINLLFSRRLYFSETTILLIISTKVSYMFEVIPFLSEVYFVRSHLINRKHVFKFSVPEKTIRRAEMLQNNGKTYSSLEKGHILSFFASN